MDEKLSGSRGFHSFTLGLDAEFDDEFAMLKLTLESSIPGYVFPRQRRQIWSDFMESVPAEDWLRAFESFVDWLAPVDGYLLLMSPIHEVLYERPRETVATLCEDLELNFSPDKVRFNAAAAGFTHKRKH